MSQSQYKDLNDFLSKHNAKNDKTGGFTHTRIGDKELNIFPGSYSIPAEELPTFYQLYYDYVFVKKKREYLTEKQLENAPCMAVDFDFRYAYDIEERIHTKEHVQDMVVLYLEELKQYYIFEENTPFDIYIFEKPNVNRVTDKNLTKDGIHMLICLQVNHVIQTMIREKILDKLGEIWEDLPLTNNWDSVLDEGISKGKTNWQLFGSRKPGNENYELVRHFSITFDSADGEFMMDEKNIREFDLKNNFYKLSVQNMTNPTFEINPKIKKECEKRMEKNGQIKKKTTKTKINLLVEEEDTNDITSSNNVSISLSEITNKEMLQKAVDIMLKNFKMDEYEKREAHEYTQILPEKYYAPGSHLLNRQVAFALKHTDERLFLSWVQLRSKAEDFDYTLIPSLYHDWKKYFINTKEQPVTRRSIIYWAKQDAYDDYIKVKESTTDYFIEETVYTQTDFDLAMVLYQIFKDKYVCISYANKGIWYVFKNHRWEPDKGISLRLAISKDMYNVFNKKNDATMNEWQNEQNEDKREFLSKKSKGLSSILVKLKRTSDKNNIMREAMEIFFDKDFTRNMDANPYLLCFTNGVFDFKAKEFRQGYPQDYITKTTNVPYVNYNYEDYKSTIDELMTFMEQLFPQPELCRYMWDHLASCLIGIKKEHAFNIYRGSGSNGKSILTDLMSHCLGDYKGTVPITLVTEKRGSIGGTSSEVIQLKGVRYAVMQEPSKDAVINEGIMKELTGGDPIQARALYSDSEIFIPQFSLVVCTNALFEIKSNDDGTWRRMKLVDFLAKFVSEDETHTDDTQYVFPKDKGLKEKLPQWATVFISMLVKRACETDGEVKDCSEVSSASNKYRQSQDCIAGFISDKIIKDENGHGCSKKVLNDVFKEWFQMNYGNRKPPKLTELVEVMVKKYGKINSKGKWVGIKIREEEEEDDMAELN